MSTVYDDSIIATSILKLQGILNSYKHILCGFSVEIGNCFSPCTSGEVYVIWIHLVTQNWIYKNPQTVSIARGLFTLDTPGDFDNILWWCLVDEPVYSIEVYILILVYASTCLVLDTGMWMNQPCNMQTTPKYTSHLSVHHLGLSLLCWA